MSEVGFVTMGKATSGAEAQIAKSVTAAMREVTDGLKQDLRADVEVQ